MVHPISISGTRDNVDERLEVLARSLGNLTPILEEVLRQAKQLQDAELVEHLQRVVAEAQKSGLH